MHKKKTQKKESKEKEKKKEDSGDWERGRESRAEVVWVPPDNDFGSSFVNSHNADTSREVIFYWKSGRRPNFI